jgi:FkbM family methyltransferase
MNLSKNKIFNKYFSLYPFNLIDIGASGGIVKDWDKLGEFVNFIGVEPDRREFVNLDKKNRIKGNVKYIDKLLHKEPMQSLEFNLFDVQTASSIFKPNMNLLAKFGKADTWGVSEVINTQADTLDNQLNEHKISDVDFIKLDTQGSELFILQGASKILEMGVFGLYVEVEFAPVYDNQPLFSDVDNLLRKHGFQLVEICRTKYWKRNFDNRFVKSRGQIVYGDVIYLRDSFEFKRVLDRNANADNDFKKAKLLKAAVLSSVYDHMDHGFEILNQGIHDGVFNENEALMIKRLIDKEKKFRVEVMNKLPHFRGKERIRKLFFRLYHLIKKKENRWANGAIWR